MTGMGKKAIRLKHDWRWKIPVISSCIFHTYKKHIHSLHQTVVTAAHPGYKAKQHW